MNWVNWINHKGKEILVLNYSKLADGEHLSQVDRVESSVQSTTQKEILKLTVITDTHINEAFMTRIEQLNHKYDSLVEKEAVVGITGLKKVLLKARGVVSSKEIKAFDDTEAAKDWLVG
ncbi:MAG: hypothetical protein GY854_23850 [Deltaproteobacteria bacterium]|nr:hypothetical protein [Deltaproteobacteria bacterium]